MFFLIYTLYNYLKIGLQKPLNFTNWKIKSKCANITDHSSHIREIARSFQLFWRNQMDIINMMRDIKQIGKKMNTITEKIKSLEASGKSGGGLVVVTITGAGNISQIKIDPSLLKEKEIEILQDLIIAAHKDAKTKLDELVQEKTAEIKSELGVPADFNLPT